MNTSIYEELIEISDFFKMNSLSESLNQMKYVNENKNCFVAFIGAFSTGKSSLINNLIGRNILPQEISVSTPLLTYIRYGNEEKAIIHLLDGNKKIKSIDEINQIVQDNKDFDFSELAYLEIFIDNDLLKSGLIFLDTPGLNSTFEKHEALLVNSLNLASKIIYVVSHIRSKNDVEKIAYLKELGFDITYVRTHCDNIRKDEKESIESFKENDKKIFSDFDLSNVIQSFYISNERKSEYFKNIDLLKNHLIDVGNNIEKVIEESSSAQLVKIIEKLCLKIAEEKKILIELKEKGDREVKLKLQNIEANINTIKNLIAERNNKYRKIVLTQIKELKTIGEENIKSSIKKSKEKIINSDVKNNYDMGQVFLEQKTFVCRNALEELNINISKLLKELNVDFSFEELDIDVDSIPNYHGYEEIVIAENENLLKYKQRLISLKEEIDSLHDHLINDFPPEKLEELKEAIKEAENQIIEAKNNNENYPEYVPKEKLISEGDNSVSQWLKVAGNIADQALFWVPGEVLAKGIGKVIAISERAVKIIKGVDKSKDVLFLGGKLIESIKEARDTKRRIAMGKKIVDSVSWAKSESKAVGLFDYFTIEHWAEKLGSLFDHPPVYGIDKEYEKRYYAEKNELIDKYMISVKNKIQMKREAGLFESDQEELIALEKAKKEELDRVDVKLKEEENRIRKDAEDTALKTWRNKCADEFEKNIKPFFNYINDYLDKVPNNLEAYSKKRNFALLENLNNQKARYEEIQKRSSSDMDNMLEKLNKYEIKLKNYSTK